MVLRRVLLLVGVLALVFASPAVAQTTTGSIVGKVTDSQGLAVPGATVTLSGPNLQGTRTAITNNTRRVSLPRSATRPRLQSDDQQAGPGAGFAGRDPRVPRSGIHRQPRHVARRRHGDVDRHRHAARGRHADLDRGEHHVHPVRIAADHAELPAAHDAGRRASRSRWATTTAASGQSPSVGASSAPENNYIIDGLSSTDPRYGTSGANLTMNFVQEVLVMTGGYQAEYGRSTGGVFNVITKSGGNQFHGDLFTYLRGQGLHAVGRRAAPEQGAGDVRRSATARTTSASRWAARSCATSSGSSAPFDPQWSTNYVGGQVEGGVGHPDAGRPSVRHDDQRLCRQGDLDALAERRRWSVTAFGDPTTQSGWLTGPNADPAAALREQRDRLNNFNIKYNTIFSSNWLIEASFGRYSQSVQLEAATDEGRAVPSQFDETIGGFIHGGFQRVQDDAASRNAFFVKMTSLVGEPRSALRRGHRDERLPREALRDLVPLLRPGRSTAGRLHPGAPVRRQR